MPLLPAPTFIPNSADGTHCGPAVWRMALETLIPASTWSFEEIDAIIRKEPGTYTWGQTFLPTMLAAGLTVHSISTWDDAQFIARDWDYVRERSGEASAAEQQAHAQDLIFVKAMMQQCLDDSRLTRDLRPATLDDLTGRLTAGAYVNCTVNSRVLNGREGFNSHSILVYGVDSDTVQFADPGPLNAGLRTAPLPQFLSAWAFNGPAVCSMASYSRAA